MGATLGKGIHHNEMHRQDHTTVRNKKLEVRKVNQTFKLICKIQQTIFILFEIHLKIRHLTIFILKDNYCSVFFLTWFLKIVLTLPQADRGLFIWSGVRSNFWSFPSILASALASASARPHVQFLQAFLVFPTSQSPPREKSVSLSIKTFKDRENNKC